MTLHHVDRATCKSVPAGAAAAAILLLSGCAGGGEAQEQEVAEGGADVGTAFGHIHGLGVDPATDELLVATHYGLFDLADESPQQISPTKDFMGFAVAGPDHYYASGHPGQGSEKPDPMGLIESTDGGETWQEISLQGDSDFHAMAVSSEGIIGFDAMDAALRFTPDGEDWTEVETQMQPAHLSAAPEGPVVLATTEQGVQRSTDGGLTWELAEEGPVLLVTAFIDTDTAVGITPEGQVHLSDDAGSTWEETGGTTGQPVAAAGEDSDGEVRLWVATQDGVELSEDGGSTFSRTVRVEQ